MRAICREDYQAGSYRRQELKGHFDYFRFNYEDVIVDAAKGNFIVLDKLADKLLARGVISEANYKLYQEKLQVYFSDFQGLEGRSDEEIYWEIQEIRKKIFPQPVWEFLIREQERDLAKLAKSAREINSQQELWKELIYYDVAQSQRFEISPINRMQQLQDEIKNLREQDLILIPDDYGQLPFLIILITDYLFSQAGEAFRQGKGKIYLLLRGEALAGEPTYNHWLCLLGNSQFPQLQELLNDKKMEMITYSNKCAGLDLRQVSQPLRALLEKGIEEGSLVLGIGEKMLFSLHGAAFNYYLLAAVKTVRAQRYSNLYHQSQGKIPFLAAYVPAGSELPADNFSGVEPISKTLYHFNLLLEREKKIWPQLRMNFYATSYQPGDFPELSLQTDRGNYYQYHLARQERFKEIIERDGLLRYVASYYNLADLSRINSLQEFAAARERLMVNGFIVEEPGKICLTPFIARDYAQGVVSPRELVEAKKLPQGSRLYFNFLYFATNKIIYTYNQLRQQRSREQLNQKNIYLGYKLEKHNKQREESFPLYNKGFVAYTQVGEVFFGNRTLEGGRLSLNDFSLSWQKEQVNALQGEEEFLIYTPFLDNENWSQQEIDCRQFNYEVGQGRLNLVVVDNQIVAVRKGGVFLPSIGVVLSLSGSLADKVSRVLDLKEIGDSYYLPGKYQLSVHLDAPGNIDREKWQETIWAYGGGTILVRKGKNLVANREEQMRSFTQEGWFHPLSKQTQETQVQDWARGPRTVIGLTAEQKFFAAVFSGRTSLSQGANFAEVVSILEKEMGSLDWVLNLDGGASSCLGLIYKQQFFELSCPAVSQTSSAGMVRPVNSMIFLTSKMFS